LRLFGLDISRVKAAPDNSYALTQRGWWPVIRESFAGAWQRNVEVRLESVLTHSAVYACISLIASDIGKVGLRLVQQDANGIWTPVDSAAFSPVLRKPNRFQNRIQFIQWWVTSKLTHGTTYVLKGRDNRGVVTSLSILDPARTKPLITPNGDVYYELRTDNLSGVDADSTVVPASEIIHDVMNPLYHPLCGVSPITACGLAAIQGLNIQKNSANFFANGSRPSGILVAPGNVSQETADRLKAAWEEGYSGANAGRTAILTDGLTYQPMGVNAVDAQLIEQLKWSAETVCSAFHVPPYMVGVGDPPAYDNVEALNQQYYSQCLQILIESIELCLDEGLGIGVGVPKDGVTYGTEFDLDDLLRMDTATQVKTLSEGVKGGIHKPNEARKKVNLSPVMGGDQVYLQQQNYSLAALAKRDAKDDPFGTSAPADEPEPQAANDDVPEEDVAAAFNGLFKRAADGLQAR
jgi:HK97 family phage portal protein